MPEMPSSRLASVLVAALLLVALVFAFALFAQRSVDQHAAEFDLRAIGDALAATSYSSDPQLAAFGMAASLDQVRYYLGTDSARRSPEIASSSRAILLAITAANELSTAQAGTDRPALADVPSGEALLALHPELASRVLAADRAHFENTGGSAALTLTQWATTQAQALVDRVKRRDLG